ncbi:hypothetical protein FJZ23_00980 [Candidatus Parcubacteria bacterium]|nr:hypothetical protein [Candidatus Parcubacteria bacterium]
MGIEMFTSRGFTFSYCRYAVFPQIPYVQDVLHVLLLSDKKDEHEYYSPASANWPTYVENLMLVAAAVAPEALDPVMRCEEVQVRKLIAEAIMVLCPPEAKCLFNNAFASAQKEFKGQPAPSRTASRNELLRACACSKCEQTLREEGRWYKPEDFVARPEEDYGAMVYDR